MLELTNPGPPVKYMHKLLPRFDEKVYLISLQLGYSYILESEDEWRTSLFDIKTSPFCLLSHMKMSVSTKVRSAYYQEPKIYMHKFSVL